MITDGVMMCDYCGAKITRVLNLPSEGWPKLHAVCSPCHDKMHAKRE